MLHQIGVGALGPVFRTYEPSRDRLVAVKVFRLDITPEQAQTLAEELTRAAEAGLFHPSIVEPLAAGVEGTIAYRAEEYVAAESLDVAMRHYAPAALDKVLPFITQLAGAIDFARAAGVGHGALHPRDIFVTPDEARATGFGVVDALDRVGLRAPVRRPYSAPERIAGEPWSTAADVFSLAAIAFELLTGRRPAGTGDQIGSIGAGPAAERLHAVLARAMHEDPSARYSTALAFAAALEGSTSKPEPFIAPPISGPVVAAPKPEPIVLAAAAAKPEPVVSAPEPDDIAAEREEDEAQWEFSREEARLAETDVEADEPPSLFDSREAEAGADELVFDAAGLALREDLPADNDSQSFLDEPGSPARRPVIVVPPRQGAPRIVTDRDFDLPLTGEPGIEPIGETEPQRTSFLALTMAVILGLLLGSWGMYALLSRTSSGDTSTASTATAPGAQTAQGTGGATAPAEKEFSEQAVSQPPARSAAPPPAAAPEVPAETTPAPRSERPAATPGPAARKARTGSVVVRSSPPGASVTVNGSWRGRTPITLEELPLGDYVVRIVAPGYDVAREEFTLTSGASSRTISRRLEKTQSAERAPSGTPAASKPATPASPSTKPSPAGATTTFIGSIYVDSRPRGAKVFIDGKEYGTTPLRIPEVRIGNHVVRLQLPNHRTWTNSIRVASGAETPVTGSLEPIR